MKPDSRKTKSAAKRRLVVERNILCSGNVRDSKGSAALGERRAQRECRRSREAYIASVLPALQYGFEIFTVYIGLIE
jgi:hypothetical protein